MMTLSHPATDMTDTAQIIISYGRRFIVRTADGHTFEATTRKKRVDFACGDQVHITPLNAEQAVIEDFLPRRNLLYRQDAWKTKLIAANVSQLLIVLAAVPTPSELLLQRALLAAEAADIGALIVLNKTDLPETEQWRSKLAFYEGLGYSVLPVSAMQDADTLLPVLNGHTSILLGQSGMGKSTLINALLGQSIARTNEISSALDSGKHTTTHAQLYDLNETSCIIDSPGLQEFGLYHLQVASLPHYFPDMRGFIGQCRFHNCSHRQEPGCALKAAAEAGHIRADRLQLLQQLTDELSTKKW